ncbi:hypothetical protein [Kitasatospora sp. NRRL B-11411]|uniref:hypothetical protein n=1 Tax=Kitasatospora sp. NRRL B-11411 TaxID=1463822 RepID=UPI0004C3F311|nr:hypothetical protein [Kitasatospora sp. NRRL B-11411]
MPPRLPALLSRLRRRAPEPPHVSPVRFPCLLVDEDGWLLPCADDAELQQLTEPGFTDEIAAAYDAAARPLEVHVIGRRETIALRPVAEPRPEQLDAHVRAYFHHWTDREAPGVVQPVPRYVAAVARAVRDTPSRRRRRP